MSDELDRVRENVSDHMNGILANFKPGRRIAVVVWNPDKPEEDFMLMGGDPVEAIDVIQRRLDAGPSTA